MLVISRKIHQGLVFKCPSGEIIKINLGEQNVFGQYAVKIDAPRSVLVLRDEAYKSRTDAGEYPWEDNPHKKMNI